jgi:hypothetical protein
MKRVCATLLAGFLLIVTTYALADRSADVSSKRHVLIYTPHRITTPEERARTAAQAAAGQTIPLWSYSIKAYDGNTYSGSMVGRAPFAHGHRTTTIPTYVIPVTLTFADTGTVFDPTQPDHCAANSDSVLNLILQSPLIHNTAFTINGVDVGTTQYLDAFQRSNFWTYVAGTPYHAVFSTSPTVLPAVQVTVPTIEGSTQSGVCGAFGQMDFDWWDNLVQTQIIPSLASSGVGPANFPQFLFDSVVMYLNGDPTQCCVLGYHNSMQNNGVFQTYSVNDYDTSGAFGEDTSVMSHELGEWLDDPNGVNPVPVWGDMGQQSGCQNNLEVGDPMSPGGVSATNSYSILMPNGVTYSLQELAYFSWFYGGSSFGAGGFYSDNGTLKGFAKPCPPGGTN